MFLKQFLKNKTNLILLLILLFAAFLRLYRIADYMTFLGDEGRDVLVAYNILHGHFTLLGPTASVGGFYFGPIYYYMMASFLWLFGYNPVGPAVMVALISIATVWLVYKLGSDFFNTFVGLIAAFLYSISPLVITYSRSSWNPNPLPFFSILTVYFVYRGCIEKSWKKLLLAGILLGIAIELHFIALFLGAVIAVFLFLQTLFIQKIKTKKQAILLLLRQYSIIFTGLLIGMLPYLGFEIRHSFSNTHSIITFIFHSKDTGGNSHLFQTISDVFFRLFGHLVTNFPTPDHSSWFDKNLISLWFIFTLIVAFGGVFLLFRQLIGTKRQTEKFTQIALITIWFITGIFLFGFYKKNIYDYYFTFLFPLPFLLTANLVVFLWHNKRIVNRIIATLLFIVITVLSLQGIPFRYEPNRQLNQTETISQFVSSKTDNKPFNFALITGGNSDHAYRYFFTIWGHPPVTIENTINDPQRKSVTDQLLIVCESIPCYPLGNSLFEIAGFGRADIAGHWKVSVVEIYKLVHYKGK